MRVAIELTALQLDRGGTARAIHQLLDGLETSNEVSLTRLEHSGAAATSGVGRLARGLQRELWYLPKKLKGQVERSGAELLHCPSPLVPPNAPVPMVVTVHDALGWDHPELLTRANRFQLRHRLPKAFADGAHLITSSEYSRARLIAALGIERSRTRVIRPGIDPSFTPTPDPEDDRLLDELGVDGRFLLTVGTLQPRKNVEAAIAAFEQLSNEHPELTLVIAGARGWQDDLLASRIKRSPVGERIKALGRVSDRQLCTLYRRASCFVFTSRYEGFGFPPLEAMASGTPVVSSAKTSTGEILGDAGVVADPDDAGSFADAVRTILDSDARAEALRSRGIEWSAQFSPQRYCDETIAFYREILGAGDRQ